MIPSFSLNLTNTTETTETYFTDPELLGNVPSLMLFMAACYAVVFILGVIMLVEKPQQEEREKTDLKKRLSESWSYFYKETLTRRDFYLLWFARFLLLLLNSGVISYWKTYRKVYYIIFIILFFWII